MGLDFTFINQNNMKEASFHYSYSGIHVLRIYALQMIGLPANTENETDPKAIENFPNLVYHNDAEGYYVGSLPSDFNESWPKEAQLWVGSVKGLYKELQKINAHMLANSYDGAAKEILQSFFKAFQEIEYDPEENAQYVTIIFS